MSHLNCKKFYRNESQHDWKSSYELQNYLITISFHRSKKRIITKSRKETKFTYISKSPNLFPKTGYLIVEIHMHRIDSQLNLIRIAAISHRPRAQSLSVPIHEQNDQIQSENWTILAQVNLHICYLQDKNSRNTLICKEQPLQNMNEFRNSHIFNLWIKIRKHGYSNFIVLTFYPLQKLF